MEPYQIAILIAFILLLCYSLFLVYAMSKVSYFRSNIKRRFIAISVLLSEKKEILMLVGELLVKSKAKLSADDKAELVKLSEIKVAPLKEKDAPACSNALNDAQKRINYIIQNNQKMLKNPEFQGYSTSLHDVDSNYRKTVAVYNSDAQAYNYWVSTPLAIWLTYITGQHKKEKLN